MNKWMMISLLIWLKIKLRLIQNKIIKKNKKKLLVKILNHNLKILMNKKYLKY